MRHAVTSAALAVGVLCSAVLAVVAVCALLFAMPVSVLVLIGVVVGLYAYHATSSR